ncbi:MAG: thiosulfohydrolase SoxB, partial [Pseudomonadota bacterium]
MPSVDRRDFIKIMGFGALATAVPGLYPYQVGATGKMPKDFYDIPFKGNVRILHITDVHGQLNPVYFREPNVNLGVGDA